MDDEFARDPAVQAMRRVFSEMETLYRKIVEAAELPPCDRRLRPWREQALRLFEQVWAKANKRGLTDTEEEVATLYAHCLARIFERGRVVVPISALSRNEAFERLITEILT